MSLLKKAKNKAKADGFILLFSQGLALFNKQFCRSDYLKQKLFKYYIGQKYSKINSLNKYLYVCPKDIKYILINNQHASGFYSSSKIPLHKMEKGRFNPSIFTGTILSGDWDLYKKPYEFDRVYSSLYQHYQQGVPLKETEYMWQYRLRGIIREDDTYLSRKINDKKDLYINIKKNGFQTQYELGKKGDRKPVFAKPWPITINIGRNGELIFNNTAHNRIAISKLLDIDEIPVLVVVRHQKWQSVRNEVKHTDDFNKLSEDTKAVIDHPDLQEFVSDDWLSM